MEKRILMAGTIEDRIYELVTPLIESMGVSVWGIRYRGGHDHAVLQVFIESDDGVSADLCGDVTHVISPALDAADIIAPAYTLEVSSPGLDRILFNKDQALDYVDSRIKVEVRIPMQGKRKFDGKLLSVDESGTIKMLDAHLGEVEIAFANISIARVVPVFKDNTVPKAAKAHK